MAVFIDKAYLYSDSSI